MTDFVDVTVAWVDAVIGRQSHYLLKSRARTDDRWRWLAAAWRVLSVLTTANFKCSSKGWRSDRGFGGAVAIRGISPLRVSGTSHSIVVSEMMARTTKRTGKRGRPKTTGAGLQVGVRWQEPLLGEIKRWASLHKVIYAEAIRQLVKKGLDCETATSADTLLSVSEVKSVAVAPVPLSALKGMDPAILKQIAAPWRDLEALVRGAQGWAVVPKKAGHRLVLSWVRK